jgi:hypothetical protein
MQESDEVVSVVWAGYKAWDPKGIYRSYNFGGNVYVVNNFGGDITEKDLNRTAIWSSKTTGMPGLAVI